MDALATHTWSTLSGWLSYMAAPSVLIYTLGLIDILLRYVLHMDPVVAHGPGKHKLHGRL